MPVLKKRAIPWTRTAGVSFMFAAAIALVASLARGEEESADGQNASDMSGPEPVVAIDGPRVLYSEPPDGWIDARGPETRSPGPHRGLVLLFSQRVFDVDGGPLRPESFSLTWTNANPDLHVAQGGSPQVVGVNASHNPMICVFISEAITVGEWTLLEGDVMNSDGVINTARLQIAHFPLDVNGDGRIDVRDATAFGRAFRRRYDSPVNLIDLNRDNRVDARDATFFGVLWRGEQGFNTHRQHTLGPMIP